jgi:hypothetical protein
MNDAESPEEDAIEQPGAEGTPMDTGAMPFDGPPEAENLVSKYAADPKTRDWLEGAAKKVVKRVMYDDDSRDEWKRQRADEIKLFAGLSEAMDAKRGGGNSPHDPVMTRTLLQLWSRGWDQICPAKGTLMQVHPNGPADEDAADRREKYMNWQLRHKVPNWVSGHGETYLTFLMAGSAFREKSWNPVTRTTEYEPLTADDVIVAWTRKDIDPMMKKVPRVSRVLRLYRWDIEQLADEGAFAKDYAAKLFDTDAPSISAQVEDSVIMDANARIEGVEAPSMTLSEGEDKELKPRDIYRVQTWLKLPDQDRMKPVMFTVDRATGYPLSLTIREAEDPFDRMRFDSEKQEWMIKSQNIASQYQMQMQQHQQLTMQGVPAQPPMQPPQPPPPRPVRTVVVHSFIHYRLFPNPAGFYGIGVGYLLKNANLLINKLEAEYLTSARLQNSNMSWLPKGTMAKRGPIEVEIGKSIETELEPEQMAGIRPIAFNPPSDGMWKFIEKVRADVSTLVADVDTMSGEAGPTNETKAAATQRMYNATALVSVIVRLYLEPLKEEIKLLAHDNRNFMDDKEFYWVTEATHQAPPAAQAPGAPPPRPGAQSTQMSSIERSDFKDEFDFTFTADQRLQTQPDRIQTISNVITQLLQIPLTQDPQRGPALFYVALIKLFRALDMPEFEQALGPPPPPPQPPQPPTPMDQVDENNGFFAGHDHPVLPDDNDDDHLMKMSDLEGSDFYKEMPATGKQLFDRHKAAHIGQLYKKEHQNGMIPNGGNLGTQGAPGLGGGPGNGGVPSGPPRPPAGPPPQPPQQMPNGGGPQ